MEFTSGRPGVGSRALSASSAASSPLLLKLELDSSYGGLIDHLTSLLAFIDSPTILLNALYTFISSISSTSAAEIADALLRIFVASAEPVWAMLGDWLHRGMPIPTAILDPEGDIDLAHDENERLLDSEFFIRRDRDVSWADEDFWEAAFVDGEDGWPSWLGGGEVRELLMEAGKAVGLLRGLTGSMTMPTAWRCLSDVLGVPSSNAAGTGMPPRSDELDISDIIRAYLAPVCSIAMFQLRRTLEDDCGLLEHLDAIDGILYIRVFGVMESWSSWLFQQVNGGH
jgi:gamma-tubulin complex component 5